jgi:probable phosphoglycerate mutase
MKLFVVRHGEYGGNVRKITNGDSKNILHLTLKGCEQANKAKIKLDKIKFDICFVTPMIRTQETANIILKDKKTPIKIKKEITELNTGRDNESTTLFWETLNKTNKPYYARFGDKENFKDVELRVFKFIEEIKKTKYQNILCVTHEGVLFMFEKYFKNLSENETINQNFPNCHILTYEL